MLVATIRSGSETDDATPPLTASIGVAMFDTPCRNANELLADADRSMYEAKKAGRNRFSISRRRAGSPTVRPEAA